MPVLSFRTATAAALLAAGAAVTGALPAAAQDAPLTEDCATTGIEVKTRVFGELPVKIALGIDSWRATERDVQLEEYIADRLASLGYTFDENADWRLVYETDAQAAGERRPVTVYSEVQSGKEPVAIGQYHMQRGTESECQPLSTYSLAFELQPDEGRAVWRGNAIHITRSTSPVADKERMADQLLTALRGDLKDAHNDAGSDKK